MATTKNQFCRLVPGYRVDGHMMIYRSTACNRPCTKHLEYLHGIRSWHRSLRVDHQQTLLIKHSGQRCLHPSLIQTYTGDKIAVTGELTVTVEYGNQLQYQPEPFEVEPGNHRVSSCSTFEDVTIVIDDSAVVTDETIAVETENLVKCESYALAFKCCCNCRLNRDAIIIMQ